MFQQPSHSAPISTTYSSSSTPTQLTALHSPVSPVSSIPPVPPVSTIPQFPPILAYSKNGLTVTFYCEKDPSDITQTLLRAEYANTTPTPMSNFIFQAAVPKVISFFFFLKTCNSSQNV